MKLGYRRIVMLGTALNTKGGISSVVNIYRDSGFFEEWPITYLATHCDGGAFAKLAVLAKSFMIFLWLLALGRVGVVHVHSASRTSFWRKFIFLILSSFGCRPIIFHLHGGGFAKFYEEECNAFQRACVRFALRQAYCVIALSPLWQNWIAMIAADANVKCIPNPAPRISLGDARRDDYSLLFLGRICRDKGCFDLATAAAKLSAEFPQIRVLFAGEGDVSALQSFGEELKIGDRLIFLGWLSTEDKWRYFSQASIFVLPSYFEGVPVSLLEAMAAGLPIIASSVGGIPDTIEHQTDGWLVTPGDIPQLIFSLRVLLGNTELRNRIGSAAKRKALTRFNVQKIAVDVGSLYRSLGFTGG